MENESFEDESVAKLLNQHYVAIKVDREERPDIDSIYMTVCQALTGQGGWPLTIVMTPDKKPFFAGTYFPKESMYGRPGLISILGQLAQQWETNRNRIEATGQHIVDALNAQAKPVVENVIEIKKIGAEKVGVEERDFDGILADEAFTIFSDSFDSVYGGFGEAPKFPSPHNLCFLLRYHYVMHSNEALKMVTITLSAMKKGGIYDWIGGGFSRYSVDRQWLIPHFEKMLYDNALLAIAYLEGYQLSDRMEFGETAKSILDYVLRDMKSPEGGFYSAEDADSEGEEGKFYTWTPEEIVKVLGDDFGHTFCEYFDVTSKGNFEGKNVLNTIHQDLSAFCRQRDLSEKEFQEELTEAREKLWEYREHRIHPHKDDKILTAWNGLMIAALAKGWKVLRDDRYKIAAVKAAEFILRALRREDGRLLARYRDGEAALLGYLEDYAFLVWGLLELFEATFDAKFLRTALELTREMKRLFWDEQQGGFFLYGSDGEQLITRPKEVYDGAMPSGNSVAALNLFRLARFTGDSEWEDLGRRCLRVFEKDVKHYSAGHAYYLTALLFVVSPGYEIILIGNPGTEEGSAMIQAAHHRFLPNSVLLAANDGSDLADIAPFLKDYHSQDKKFTAYVCQGFTCQAPTNDYSRFLELI